MAKTSKGANPGKFSRSVLELNPQLNGANPLSTAPPARLNTESEAIQPPHGKTRRLRKSPEPKTRPEREMALILKNKRHEGLIHSFVFEGMTIEAGEGQTYTPDFSVVTIGGGLKFIECKGEHIHRTGLEKFKSAQKLWPLFRFEMHQLTREGWRQIA